jgi:hypothetical protein
MAYTAKDEEQRMQAFCEQFPNAEHAELLRFCRARPRSVEDAAHMYENYLQWRAGQGSAENLASAASVVSPRFVQSCGVALDGTPLFYVLGAGYNPEIGPEQHVLALAHAIDQVAPSSKEGKGTVLIDVRLTRGLFNFPAHRMVPLFQMAASVLQASYPERLHKLIIYPMPALVGHLWWVVKGFLDAKTAEKVEILSGSAGFDTPCPETLGKFIALQQLPQGEWDQHKELSPLPDGQQPLHGAEADDGGKPEDNVQLPNKE